MQYKYSNGILLFSKNARQISTNLSTGYSSVKGIQSSKPSICPKILNYEKTISCKFETPLHAKYKKVTWVQGSTYSSLTLNRDTEKHSIMYHADMIFNNV